MEQPTVRAYLRDDDPAVGEMLDRLSPTTVFRRFFTLGQSGPLLELRSLAEVDGADRAAVVAVVDGTVVGLARYYRLGDTDRADVAILVEDAWQRHGLGVLLLRRLAAAAMNHGIRSFHATVLGENRPALGLLSHVAPRRHLAFEHGEYDVVVDLAA